MADCVCVPVRVMRYCTACGAEFILTNVVPDETATVRGVEQHTFVCSECHVIEHRMVFIKDGRETDSPPMPMRAAQRIKPAPRVQHEHVSAPGLFVLRDGATRASARFQWRSLHYKIRQHARGLDGFLSGGRGSFLQINKREEGPIATRGSQSAPLMTQPPFFIRYPIRVQSRGRLFGKGHLWPRGTAGFARPRPPRRCGLARAGLLGPGQSDFGRIESRVDARSDPPCVGVDFAA